MYDTSRRQAFEELQKQRFDLIVIGGGITGAGIARDAALRGLQVVLVEKSDFGSGTSSKSSKLIHGGLRYLQHAEFGLVFEAVSERTLLLKLAPHLVKPQLFLVPTYKGHYPGRFVLGCGMWMYDALSKFAAPDRHRAFRKKGVQQIEPTLRQDGLTGGVTYYDGMTDDARLTLETLLDAQNA
ncbi:MAG TPA: FAD-dependent oxidoreductase, partial [Pseudomonadota bacterium]|nr:FAD-dependent oxidoreductase [Pseudomonadota bacterium]